MVIRELTADLSLHTTRTAYRHNLPIQVTSFIGRERDLAEVKRLLTGARLVTLTGSGGVGKTRLAIQITIEEIENFYDGVWLVEFAPLSNPALIPQLVATTLGLREQPGHPILNTLLDSLSHQNLLLVLDNCEHLIEASAQLANAILQTSPHVKILVTSREPLGIAGETLFRVPPLSLPDMRHKQSAEALAQYDAVRLFVDRAALLEPTFRVTKDNAPAIAQVCSRLDGMPLALELAAARIKVLSVEQISERLRDRFRLLTGASRAVLPRHQTLRTVIDWSYSLLTEAERILLRRLSVFAGGWTLEAAEQIAHDEDSLHPADVLDLLTRLVDKSLVGAEAQGGVRRFEMLETIRLYARDKLLESGEAARVQNRHLEFFVELAEDAGARSKDDEQVIGFNRMEMEHDNLRAALEWSRTAQGIPEGGLRLAAALSFFWGVRGYSQEGREYLIAALGQNPSYPTELRANALRGAGYLAYVRGDYPEARTLLDASLTVNRQLGPAGRHGLAQSLLLRGYMESEVGEYATASALILQGLDIMRELADEWGIASALRDLGGCAVRAGDYAQAAGYFEEALPLFQRFGDHYSTAITLSGLAEIALRQANYERATGLEQESLTLRRKTGDKWGIAVSLGNLAWTALRRGDPDQTVVLLEESVTLRREIGDPGGIAWCLEKLAQVALIKAQSKSARQRLENFERAACLLGAAAALRAPGGSVVDLIDRPEYERQLTLLRTQLREPTFAAMWAKGQALTLEQAVEYAFAAAEPTVRAAEAAQSSATRRASKRGSGGLTARQLQVVRLLAEGKSNRTIAGELVVSERTVENHVADIMSKLGFTTRTQIAVWAVAQQLTQTDSRP